MFLWHILSHNVIPLCIMIGLGAVMERHFKLDIRTFSKLIFYLFTPVMLFKMLYESRLSAGILLQIVGFIVFFLLVLYAIVDGVARLRGLTGGMRSAMRNSVLFYNSANYAIPLNQLVFAGNPFTMSVQLIVMVFQSILPHTYGVYAVNAHKSSTKQIMKTILGMPAIYVIPLALLMNAFRIPVPKPIFEPITYISNGYVALSLLTLGVQLGQMVWRIDQLWEVLISNALRLIAGPLIGFGIVMAMGLEGLLAQALVLSCAVPTSLSSVLLSVEFDNEPEFAGQAVFASTLFSIVTVTAVIYCLRFIP